MYTIQYPVIAVLELACKQMGEKPNVVLQVTCTFFDNTFPATLLLCRISRHSSLERYKRYGHTKSYFEKLAWFVKYWPKNNKIRYKWRRILAFGLFYATYWMLRNSISSCGPLDKAYMYLSKKLDPLDGCALCLKQFDVKNTRHFDK